MEPHNPAMDAVVQDVNVRKTATSVLIGYAALALILTRQMR